MDEQYVNFLKEFCKNANLPIEYFNELLVIHTHSIECNSNKYLKENIDLSDFRAQERYNRFIKFVKDKKINIYTLDDFDKIDIYNVIKIFSDIILQLFDNDSYIKEEIFDFLKLIKIEERTGPMDGVVYEFKDTLTMEVGRIVYVPSMNDTSSIICLAHEFIHYHYHVNEKYEIKKYYNEILSILSEKLASIYLYDNNIDSSIIKKIEMTRLDSIQYHYVTRVQELSDLKTLSTIIPDLKSQDFLSRLYTESKMYYDSLAQSYGIGYIYSENMLKLYETENNFKNKLIDVLKFNTSLQSILDYYEITANKKEVFDVAKQKVRSILK